VDGDGGQPDENRRKQPTFGYLMPFDDVGFGEPIEVVVGVGKGYESLDADA